MEFEELKRVFLEQADKEGGEFLLSLVNSWMYGDVTFSNRRFALRRTADTVLDAENRTIRTEFFCFPQDGGKDKMQQGGMIAIDTVASGMDGMLLTMSEPGCPVFRKPDKAELYRGIVASRAGKLIAAAGSNTFLFHDVLITSPDGQTDVLEEFPFERYPLFMLGLIGGEFKIGIQRKNV